MRKCGDFPTPSLRDKDSFDSDHDPSGDRDQIRTDVDHRSTRLENDTDAAHEQLGRETITTDRQSSSPDRNDGNDTTYTDHEIERLYDQKFSERTDTTVPDVSDSESD